MNEREQSVTEDELHAHVDGQLPADRLAAVEAWLANHPDDMARIAGWRAQNAAIRARYGGAIDEPVPNRLTPARLAPARRSWTNLAAAAVAAFLIGGFAGWLARGASAAAPSAFESVTAEALDAYKLYVVEVRHPVEVPGSEEAHLVQWLSKRLGYQLRAPDLTRFGMTLVGGRLLPGAKTGAAGAGGAAFFMYETASGERFTLYSERLAGPDTALRYSAADKTSAFVWVDREIAYVVSGQTDRQRLWDVAAAAYDQLDPRSPRQRGS
jgi:anti-sigma factor RsiW